jgi:DTW domain-containing protein YfiP
MPTYLTTTKFCAACRLRTKECVCAQAPQLKIATRLFVIIHFKEWIKSSNTGHLVRLAIKDSEVRLQGLPHQMVSREGIDPISPSTLVLFPGRGARPLTEDYVANLPRPLTLLVPDGNWNQAKNMMRRLPMLNQAHPVRLEGPSLDLDCLRRNRYVDRMSTFEAIAQALGILEGRETEVHLLKFFQGFLQRMYRKQGAGGESRF